MLRTKTTIDKSIQLLIDTEREHWRHILTRIIAIVKRLAKNTFPFRGDDERLHVENNDLFLQMVEMVSKFDLVIQEHLRWAKAREIQYTYLGKKIQNELIQLLANEVRSSIVKKVKHAKYFEVMLDCNPDDSAKLPTVEEHWLEFLKVDDTIGLGVAIEFQKALIKLDLDIDDIRRQGYDNESNMRGKNKECNEDPKVKSEAESLAIHELQIFEFLLGMIIWKTHNLKKKFDESCSDEVKQSADESFRVEYFVFIIDQALSSLRTRFE
ncbi:zinc finger MYM-type protein 1-like [Olea europaea var. sylvestris]|uniref:zinc finger MYM-type protein 1-like n=1 Tax=Olea europaea var. sylvestris TaxID=158386 RepID=UPI000C1D7061|nr:zinc finger MYM-type protein 1-like [Olea europaea var. sylvestris]